MRNQAHKRSTQLAGFIIALGLLLAMTVVIADQTSTTFGSDEGPAMRLVISDQPEACLADVCQFPLDAEFTLAVEAVVIPEAGYILAATYVNFGPDLVYNLADSFSDEVIWPDCEPLTVIGGQGNDEVVNHGCLTGIIAPPASTFVGNIVELSFNCSEESSNTIVELLPLGDDLAATAGSLFTEAVTNLQVIPKLSNLTIICGDPPTPTQGPTNTPGGATETPTPTEVPSVTPTLTATPTPATTPTAMPTATVVSVIPCGDVNGDLLVNSQDALWVLWFSTGVILYLPFPDDVNGDGVTDPLDALYILWIELNLFRCL